MSLVALGFERRTMTFRAGVVIAHTHNRGGGIVSAFTRCAVAWRFSVFVQGHAASLSGDAWLSHVRRTRDSVMSSAARSTRLDSVPSQCERRDRADVKTAKGQEHEPPPFRAELLGQKSCCVNALGQQNGIDDVNHAVRGHDVGADDLCRLVQNDVVAYLDVDG